MYLADDRGMGSNLFIAEASPRGERRQASQLRIGTAPAQSKFDDHESDYEGLVERSIRFSGRDHSFFVGAKARHLISLIAAYVGEPAEQRVLDVGCGSGATHPHLRAIGSLVGVDVAESMLARAKRENPGVSYRAGDALNLPFEDREFDAAFAITVLHHVDPSHWRRAVDELRRVVRVGGIAVIFEHNPFNPLTRLAVNRCEFDDDAVLLSRGKARRLLQGAGLEIVGQRYILLTPWRNATARWLEDTTRQLPLASQYYVAGRVRGDR